MIPDSPNGRRDAASQEIAGASVLGFAGGQRL